MLTEVRSDFLEGTLLFYRDILVRDLFRKKKIYILVRNRLWSTTKCTPSNGVLSTPSFLIYYLLFYFNYLPQLSSYYLNHLTLLRGSRRVYLYDSAEIFLRVLILMTLGKWTVILNNDSRL